MNPKPDPRDSSVGDADNTGSDIAGDDIAGDVIDGDVIDDESFDDDPYDSFVGGVPFAHHVISPALLAGLSGAPIALCRTFHRALFEMLDGVGGFDGLIVTPAAPIGPSRSPEWSRALRWLRTWPAPDANAMYDEHLAAGYEPDEASDHVEHTVMHHSLDLAMEVGTNPSFTHASLPSVSHALLLQIASEIEHDDVRHVDALTEVAIALLAITSFECRLDGGARVVDVGALLELASERAASA